jgi:hypothetical protein
VVSAYVVSVRPFAFSERVAAAPWINLSLADGEQPAGGQGAVKLTRNVPPNLLLDS